MKPKIERPSGRATTTGVNTKHHDRTLPHDSLQSCAFCGEYMAMIGGALAGGLLLCIGCASGLDLLTDGAGDALAVFRRAQP